MAEEKEQPVQAPATEEKPEPFRAPITFQETMARAAIEMNRIVVIHDCRFSTGAHDLLTLSERASSDTMRRYLFLSRSIRDIQKALDIAPGPKCWEGPVQ